MKKRLLKDTWFQMFAAIGGVAYVVSVLGTTTATHSPPAAAAKAAALPAAPAVPVPAPASAVRDEVITPAPASSSDLAAYNGVTAATRDPSALVMGPSSPAPPPPAAAPAPSSPPKFTLTGTGVGNTQGIVGGAVGGLGTINSLLGGLLGSPQAATSVATRAPPARKPIPSYNRVVPSRPGVITVGPSAGAGVDTTSLRDAAFSAGNGDLILVKPGAYEGPVEVTGKSVRIRGTGAYPGAVTVRWTGPGATISVRGGSLDLEKLWIERGAYDEFPRAEPGGAVYAYASALTMRQVQLNSNDAAAPPLIVEKGDKAARVEAEDSKLIGSTANLLVRGAVKVKLTRVSFDSYSRPLAAWIDAAVELVDCRFLDTVTPPVISAYEGARVGVAGKQKPRIDTTRGSESTAFEEAFGGGRPAASGGGFARDIFRRGRKPGDFP